MALSIDDSNLDQVILVGDKILIKPKMPKEQTKSGLYLPPSVEQKQKVTSGYVVKVGPGYPIPALTDTDEPWKNNEDEIKYLPLQPQVGDLAVYMQNSGFEILFNNEKYIIVPHSAILMLVRDEGLFD